MKKYVMVLCIILLFMTSGCGSSKGVRTQAEADSVIRLSYSEAHDLYSKSMDEFQEIVDDFAQTVEYWNINYDSIKTTEDIAAYEKMWKSLAEKAENIYAELSGNRCPEDYEAKWLAYANCFKKISELSEKCTNLDTDNDNEYTFDEMTSLIKDVSVDIYGCIEEGIESADELASMPQADDSTSDYYQGNDSTGYKCVECGKDAPRTYTNPFSGQIEHYCETHYQEIVSTIGSMESDVGASSQSEHTCEVCSREGTHRYESFTGQTEYYCTEHYDEMMDMLKSFDLD